LILPSAKQSDRLHLLHVHIHTGAPQLVDSR